MNDGWHRLTDDQGMQKIQFVFRNHTDIGSVSHLIKRGWVFEPVCILNPDELDQRIAEAIRMTMNTI